MFQVVYGRPPHNLKEYIAGTTHIQVVDNTLTKRAQVLEELKRKLAKAQETMKNYAGQTRVAHKFAVGDLVFVKLKPYMQHSMVDRRIHKLSKRFYDPFRLLKAVGEVAFQLELPPNSWIHPVFHVSQLKPCSQTAEPELTLPTKTMNNQLVIQLLAVLEWKARTNDNKWQVLLHWEDLFRKMPLGKTLNTFKTIIPISTLRIR